MDDHIILNNIQLPDNSVVERKTGHYFVYDDIRNIIGKLNDKCDKFLDEDNVRDYLNELGLQNLQKVKDICKDLKKQRLNDLDKMINNLFKKKNIKSTRKNPDYQFTELLVALMLLAIFAH